MKSSIGIALSVSYLPVPRDPSSSDTRAITFSSGASITLTKSNWPSVAHWALTVAPSCSISRLTSRIRLGLFLIVCTPSGVSVVSMMYVGTTASLVRRDAALVPRLTERWMRRLRVHPGCKLRRAPNGGGGGGGALRHEIHEGRRRAHRV